MDRQLPNYIYPVKRLVIHEGARTTWCQFPYPGHPKGCPNYGRAEKCPPYAPTVDQYFDLDKSLWLVHSEFDLVAHVARMFNIHPTWTERKCRCVLYWQSQSRKALRYRSSIAMEILGVTGHTQIPEAMGVNVYATALLSGLRLESIRNLKTCRHVAMIGTKKRS